SRCMILLFLFQLYRDRRLLHSFPTRRSSDLVNQLKSASNIDNEQVYGNKLDDVTGYKYLGVLEDSRNMIKEENKVIIAERVTERSEEHTSELQSRFDLVCRLLLEKKNNQVQ